MSFDQCFVFIRQLSEAELRVCERPQSHRYVVLLQHKRSGPLRAMHMAVVCLFIVERY